MKITIPEFSLVVLIGVSGSGKSTFARRHFKPTEILSSDFFRGLVADDENDQSASGDAFEILHLVLNKRLAGGRLTVIDATNVQVDSRKSLLNMARQHNAAVAAIVLDVPEDVCHERNRGRADRRFGGHVVRRQAQQLRQSINRLRDEGFRYVYQLSTIDQINNAIMERTPLLVNRKTEMGPFDIIGDIHGCFIELRALLEKLGYLFTPRLDVDGRPTYIVNAPPGRKAVFLGDLVDRGPDAPGVLRLVMHMVESGIALCVPGNHDAKLLKKLQGREVNIGHGFAVTLQQLDAEPPIFRERIRRFIDQLPSHLVLDEGRLVVAHAGLKEEFQGRMSGRVRDFALYGETTGESDEFGLPVRLNWAAHYRGRAAVVYGHTPVAKPEWLNRTMCVDTGCVYGGALTALRYPEQEVVSVPAQQKYWEAKRPFLPPLNERGSVPSEPARSAQQVADDVLDINDIIGHRNISTRLIANVTIREGQAAAALEAVSRFAIEPRWLIYLPPTMSPCESAREPGYLEYPSEAFHYYRGESVDRVICQQKHMGSRAIVVIARNAEVIQRQFGIVGDAFGMCYTRTGRRFFDDRNLEAAFLQSIRARLDAVDFWGRLESDWFCFDGELMPWSAKAQELLIRQYAAVGVSGQRAFDAALPLLAQTSVESDELAAIRSRLEIRRDCHQRYIDAYRRYCWQVHSVADLQFAPFHLMAYANHVPIDRDHAWHMETLASLAEPNGLLRATPHRIVHLDDPASVQEATTWWHQITEAGAEGMVVKPLRWVQTGKRGLIQPAIKVRGREYLRIIYGPDYTMEDNLTRLRQRGLGMKRSLAAREFALGIEALDRFIRKEPLRRIHECCFSILALESEPIDPRL